MLVAFLLAISKFGQAAACPSPLVDSAAHNPSLTISRDACIVGGGASGTYTAISLRDKGKSVTVIEAQSVLEGILTPSLIPLPRPRLTTVWFYLVIHPL